MKSIGRIVESQTAGSPVNPGVVWTNLSPRSIADELRDAGYTLCPETVRRILREDLELGLRQAVKCETTCNYSFRDEQFQYIEALCGRQRFWDSPILSIDTKKKELLGDFRRPGRAWTDGHVVAPDHDYASRATGKLVPYGVYDMTANQGFMMLTTSDDTPELACDAVLGWWRRCGQWRYPHCTTVLLLCDCGGSNGYRQYLFKQCVKELAMRLGKTIRVAHYPPGCSKYNPIEHRLFCHVERSLTAVTLNSIDTAARFIRQTKTSTGLSVIVEKARKIYRKAQKAAAAFLERMPIVFDSHLPDLNYYATAYDY